MTARPACLALVDGYVAGATIAHEYAFGLHRKLVAVNADDDRSHELLRESVAVTLEVSTVVQRLYGLENKWIEQDLLDPPEAERTAQLLNDCVAELVPELAALRDRQGKIVSELVDLVSNLR
jgi:hypothetical protein